MGYELRQQIMRMQEAPQSKILVAQQILNSSEGCAALIETSESQLSRCDKGTEMVVYFQDKFGDEYKGACSDPHAELIEEGVTRDLIENAGYSLENLPQFGIIRRPTLEPIIESVETDFTFYSRGKEK